MTGDYDYGDLTPIVNAIISFKESWIDLIFPYATSVVKFGSSVSNVVSDAFLSVWNAFMSTYPGKILGFIWDLITFLLYGVRSLVLLVWNIIYTILNGFVVMFTQLLSTFTDLSYFMGSSTSLFIGFFTFILLVIGFGFLFRFFIGRYHYKGMKK